MNWLITGGCGFIGRNLIRMLVENDSTANVRVIDNFSVGKPDDLIYATPNIKIAQPGSAWQEGVVQVMEGDIMDADLAMTVTQGADVVVHLAANTGVGPSVEDPRSDCMTNVIGTFNYLDACRTNNVGRFVFASSGAPIGECVPPIHEELACHPVSPYGASKLAGEAYCSAFSRTFGVDTVALRFGNVYGPGSTHKSSVVAKFIRQALNGETLEIYGSGNQTRDFIYIGDLIKAIKAGVEMEGIGGEVFQIATSRETTVKEVTEQLVKELETRVGRPIDVVFGPSRLGDVMRNFSDTTKARDVLKWQAEYDLSMGLVETIEWFLPKTSEDK